MRLFFSNLKRLWREFLLNFQGQTTNEEKNSLFSGYFMRVHKFYIVVIAEIKDWERNRELIHEAIILGAITYRRAIKFEIGHTIKN